MSRGLPPESRGIDEVAWTLRMARDERRKGCVLLIGAGCSVTAGIPAAAGIVAAIRKQYRPFYDRAREKTYPLVMAQLAAGERRDLIARYVDEAKVNWAHVCIAQLMKEGFVNRILTTNFDPLVVRACALVGHFPAVYDFAASQIFRAGDIPHDAVVYLHGQRSGFVLMNTSHEVEQHAERLKPVFDEAGQGRVWIVVGYSGESDPVFERLAEFRRFDNRLYWVGYGDGDPPRHVSERLLVDNRDAFYVSGFDADSFFLKLAQALGCFPPDFIGKPFSYLAQLMETLSTSEDTQQGARRGPEFMSRAKDMIREAVEQYETGVTAETGRQAKDLLLAGRYDEIERMEPEEGELTPEIAASMAWARVLEGNELADAAVMKSGTDADQKFAEAYEAYEAALRIEPDLYDALRNWAITLVDQAKTKQGQEADRLFAAAYEKYEAALALDADDADPLRNWANALADQARTKHGPKADTLFADAYEKYEAARALDPDDADTQRYWADALGDQAKTKRGAEADRLFAAAHVKYEAALALNPYDTLKLRNVAITLADQAKTKQGEEADRLFDAAYEKYKAALVVNPEDADSLRSWANALADQAKTKQESEADRIFAAAYEKHEAALALGPVDPAGLGNWAGAIVDQAKMKEGAEADSLFAAAYEKYEAALALDADDADRLRYWADALADQAKMKEGAEADSLFAAAYEKYEAALVLEPDDSDALGNWGLALLDQGGTKLGDEAVELFREGDRRFQSAEASRPGSAAYNLVCSSALLGRPDEARRWLEASIAFAVLPPAEELEHDADLDSVRDESWFRDLVAASAGTQD
jgi:tetratricopeptide (TPR) repeat protein/NAD-dependent SIR2 family protein deacetylase